MSTAENFRASRETGQWLPVEQLDVCRRGLGSGETLTIGATSTNSNTPFPSGTTAVRVVSTVDCWVEVGSAVNATANTSFFLPANSPEYFAATAGDRVAVIQASAGGFLYERPVS